MYNLLHYFPDKWQVRINQNFLKCLIIYQRMCLETYASKWINLWESYLMAALSRASDFFEESSIAEEFVIRQYTKSLKTDF